MRQLLKPGDTLGYCAINLIEVYSISPTSTSSASVRKSIYQVNATAEVRGSAPAVTVLVAQSIRMPALSFIDLRTPDELSRYFREDVVKAAQVQYVRE